MKKVSLVVVVGSFAVAGLFAVSASAFDIGGAVKSAAIEGAKAGGRAVVEKEINKKLREKNCTFKPKTTELTCDINDILGNIKTQKTVAEKSGLSNDVDLYVEIGRGKDKANSNLATERQDLIRNKLRSKISWWDWYDSIVEGDGLNIFVKVQ